MFYIYNETSKQLELTKKSDKFFHIGIKDENVKFGIDIMTKDMEDIEEKYNTAIFESLESVQMLAFDSYKVAYNHKSGNPFLITEDEITDNSYDAFLLVYKYNEEENGMKLFNEKRVAFNLLYSKHDVENNIIYVIGIAKPVKNPKFFLTFANESGYNTKHMMFNRKSIALVYNKYYTTEEAKENKFAALITTPTKQQMLVPNKPNKPFAIVVGHYENDPERMGKIMKTFHINEKYVKCVDYDSKGIYRQLQELKNKEHYNCITFVIDVPFEEAKNGFEFKIPAAKFFKNINFITSDNKIIYRK